MENFDISVDPENPDKLRVEIEGIVISIWKREKGVIVDSYHPDYRDADGQPPYSALFVPWKITDSEHK